MGSGVLGQDSPPPLLSVERFTTLASSLLVALSSGTNYVYSAYAPQLGAQLSITHTQLNVIGLAGNGAMRLLPGLWTPLISSDSWRLQYGPIHWLLVAAFVCLFTGYSGIRYFYNSGGSAYAAVPTDATGTGISTFSFCLLVFCSFLTGAGGNGGLTSSMNATARSFPDQMRASAAGLVISGFGLSAFFFSTIAHIFFPGDTSSLLLLLSLGTSLPMLAGVFLVKAVPLPAPDGPVAERQRRESIADRPTDSFAHAAGVDDALRGDAVIYDRTNESHARLLGGHDDEEVDGGFLRQDPGAELARTRSVESVELAGASSSQSSRRHRSASRAGHSRSSSRVIEVVRDVKGLALLMSGDFWLLFAILSLLSGTGLMYINNVGSISQALFAKGNPNYDKVEAGKWQSMQVSTISIANCIGRLVVGLGADIAKNTFSAPRSFCISVVAAFFILSQCIATRVESTEELWKASALLGLAYGGVFGLFPTITIEWFGLSHFSENWGFVSISPMLGGNLFSIAFGRNLDRHAAPSVLPRGGIASAQQCYEGRECYATSLYMTIVACTMALVLAVFAGWRDRRRMRVPLQQREAPEVIWEGEET